MKKLLLSVLCWFLLSTSAWAAPIIFYTDIVAGPKTGGEGNNGSYLSIFGTGFGNNIADVSVTVGGGAVTSKIYLGPSLGRPDVQQLSVQLGSAVATGAIVVTVSGTPSTNHPDCTCTFTVRSGNFYYMATTGSDTTGVVNDITHPYRTMNKIWSITALAAGDFIVIRGGTYVLTSGQENLFNSRWCNCGLGTGRSSGTYPFNFMGGSDETHSIVLQGYPGEFPIIDWGSDTTGNLRGVWVNGPGWYIDVTGLIFDLKESGGFAIYYGFYSFSGDDSHCWGCRITNLRIRGGMNAGGLVGGVNTMSLQRVDGLKMYGVDVGNQSANANPALESHVIYLSHWYTNADLGWLYVHDNAYGRAALQIAGDGWGATPFSHGTLYGNSGTWGANTNVKVHDSYFLNLPHECILTNLGSIGPIYFYNNVISNCMRTQQAGFLPIAFRGSRDGSKEGTYYWWNNTLRSRASGSGTALFQLGYNSTWPTLINFLNNITVSVNSNENYYYKYNTNVVLGTDITGDYNIWYGSSQGVPSWEGSHSSQVNPLLVDTTVPNFHLQTGSPAIDTGTSGVSSKVTADYDANPRPVNTTYDMGAFEVGTGGGGGGGDVTAPVISAVSSGTPTSTTATLTWTTDEAADTQCDYGLTTGYGTSTTLNTTLAVSHSCSLTGLSTSTTYHFRVKSRDAAGNIATGSDNTFDTLTPPDTTAPSISNIAVSAVTRTGVSVSWTTDEASTSVVEYGLTTSYGNTITNSVAVTSHAVPVTPLAPGTQYHYRVKSTDASSNTATSNDATFTTSSASSPVTRNTVTRGSPTTRTASTDRTIVAR